MPRHAWLGGTAVVRPQSLLLITPITLDVCAFLAHPILSTIKSIQENISLHLSYPFCLSAYLDSTCANTLDAMLLVKRN